MMGAAFLGLVAFAAPARAQDIGPTSFRDSLVMRQIMYRAPCPRPVPLAWSRMDSTLGRPPRCSLVEIAARAIAQFHQARPQAALGDPWNPLCVRVAVWQNTGTTGLPGDWLVLFDLAPDVPAWIVIDRQHGEIGAVLVGRGRVPDNARCLTG